MKERSRGFILPTVLVVGLGTLIIGLSLIQTSSSMRASIENLYYKKVASLATEAGMDYANYCLKANNYLQSWGPAASRPNLTQSTDCYGAPLANSLSSIVSSSTVSSTFSVGDVTRGSDGSYIIAASSTTNRTSVAGTIASFSNNSIKIAGFPGLKDGQIAYAYYYPSVASGQSPGAYYAVHGADSRYHVAGAGFYGQLGNNSTADSSTLLTYPIPGSIQSVSAYANFSSQGYNLFIANNDGSVYGSGLGDTGQLGNSSFTSINKTPQKFNLPSTESATFVAPKGDATYVLTASHNIYSAGSCANGQLGLSSRTTGASGSCGGNLSVPIKIVFPFGSPVTTNLNTLPTNNFAIDGTTAFVRMQGGQVYGWGNNYWGELGNGGFTSSKTPIQIGTFGNSGQPQAVQIAFDGDTLYVVDSNGAAWASGRNDYGQMGYDPSVKYYYNTFQKVPIPSAAGKVVQVSTDQWTSVFRTDSGQVWGNGYDSNGELGNGATSSTTTAPVRYILPSGVNATYIYNCGLGKTSSGLDINNTMVIGDNYKVYGAGNNSYGQLGLGYTSTNLSTPAPMLTIDGSTIKAQDVATGLGTTVVLTTDQRYYTVGNNNYGQLANGTTTNTSTPTSAPNLKPLPAYLL